MLNDEGMTCNILTYGEIDRAEWSRLVRENATGTWFQTPEAYDFFASMPDLFRPFVVGAYSQPLPKGKGERLRGVCVGYVTVEKNPIKQFFTRRAIIIGGPALADDCTDEEVSELMKAIRNGAQWRNDTTSLVNDELMSPIYIETRNFNDYSRWRSAFEAAGFAYQPHLNFHVDTSSVEAMWERMSENRKRQIKKGKPNPDRGSMTVHWTLNRAELFTLKGRDVSEADIREWYAILAELYRTKVKTPLWPVEFFLEAYRQGVGKFLLVKHDGKVIGGSMVVKDEGCVYEWFECGLNSAYKDQYPSVMATYAGMLYAHEKGCRRYDMMGAGVPGVPYGVRDFKAEFGGEMVEHGRFLNVCKPLLYAIGKIAVKWMKE